MRIGVISDTHNFLDPQVPELFAGVEHILHGGDIGHSTIIKALEKLAPVTAVTGNCDSGIPYRETEVVVLAGRKFLLHHIVDVRKPAAIIQRLIDQEQPEAVIFGHTHKPFQQVIGKTVYFNPGYAGKQRFRLERTVAILHCAKGAIRAEWMKL